MPPDPITPQPDPQTPAEPTVPLTPVEPTAPAPAVPAVPELQPFNPNLNATPPPSPTVGPGPTIAAFTDPQQLSQPVIQPTYRAEPVPQAPEAYTPPAYVPPTPQQAYGPGAPQQAVTPQWQPQQTPQQFYPSYEQAAPVVMGGTPAFMTGTPGPSIPQPPKSKKKLLLFGGTAFALLLLVMGGVFGLYLPNTPNNVFSTGINRSGQAVKGIVTAATQPQKLASYKTSEISGNVTASFSGTSYSGNFDTKFDQTSLDGGLDFTLKDTSNATKTVSAKILSQIASGNTFPDIYFQVNGLNDLGLGDTEPALTSYDGKWIVVGSDYLKSIGANYLSGLDTSPKQITSSDIAELARTASTVTTNYVFSTNKNTAVLTEKQFVGKEKVDGLNTYHYKVGINLAHAKAYCTALTNSLMDTDAYQKLSGQTASEISDAKKSTAQSCSDGVNSGFKSSDTLDMWVDAKYKLIHKIRAYDDTNKGSYFEIGQVYKGGNSFSFFSNYHDASSKLDTNFTLDTDFQSNATKGTISVVSSSSDDPGSVKVTLSSKSLTAPVTITKPANPVPIQTVLQSLGIGSPVSDSTSSDSDVSLQGDAQNSKRETDIQFIQTELEAYFQSNGGYPTLADINSSAWRVTNMPDFDASALQDPNGTTEALASTVSPTQYAYAPTGCDGTGDTCTGYTLTADLTGGGTYIKQNLD